MNVTIENKGIAFVGDLTVDNYPESGTTHHGGASLNGAIWALRLGAKRVSIVAAVGTDQAGELFLEKINSEGIHSEGLSVLQGVTSSIDIIIDSHGDHRWGTWNAGVLADYHLGEPEYRLLQKHAAASLTIYGKTRHLLPEFGSGWRKRNKPPFLAVNFDDLSQLDRSIEYVAQNIQNIDAGFFGLDFKKNAQLLSGLKRLAKETGKLIVVTLGKHGAKAWRGDDEYSASALNVPHVVDTTGAGDAFLAAFLVEYLQTKSVESAIRKGNMIAGKKIQMLGAY